MIRSYNFRGESFELDTETNILSFHIRETFFSAGKQFGWKGATVGLGINDEALEFACRNKLLIRVTVGSNKNTYEISALNWRAFARQHKAFMTRGQTRLCICQWDPAHFKTISQDKDGSKYIQENL